MLHLPLAQNNAYAKESYLGVARSVPADRGNVSSVTHRHDTWGPSDLWGPEQGSLMPLCLCRAHFKGAYHSHPWNSRQEGGERACPPSPQRGGPSRTERVAMDGREATKGPMMTRSSLLASVRVLRL